MTQLTLLPELPDSPSHLGVVYLMTDGYLLKWGYTGRSLPGGLRQRSGELRAQIIGFKPGTRDDEDRHKEYVSRWCVGGEWFRLPDDPAVLYWLQVIAQGMGGWGCRNASELLARVIVANLRHAA